jgi:hypothetical protein
VVASTPTGASWRDGVELSTQEDEPMNYFAKLIERLRIKPQTKTDAATPPEESPTIAVEPVEAPAGQSRP